MIQKHYILLFKPMLITAALEYKLNNYNKKLTGFSNESVVLICEFFISSSDFQCAVSDRSADERAALPHEIITRGSVIIQ